MSEWCPQWGKNPVGGRVDANAQLSQHLKQNRRMEHQQQHRRQKTADLGIVSAVGLSRVSNHWSPFVGHSSSGVQFQLRTLMPAVFADELSLLDALSLSLYFIIIRPLCVLFTAALLTMASILAQIGSNTTFISSETLLKLIQNWIWLSLLFCCFLLSLFIIGQMKKSSRTLMHQSK